MTLRHLTLGGAAAIAFSGLMLSSAAISATPTAAPAAVAPVHATTPLDKVTNPTRSLAKLQVVNREGLPVGMVVDVVTRSDGKALIVTVDAAKMLGGKPHWVGIEATKMALDPSRRILVAYLTRAEIKALPSLS